MNSVSSECPALAGIIGNRVKIPNDPVTVNGESSATCHCPKDEKARQAAIRESGNLLRWKDEVSSAESCSSELAESEESVSGSS